MCLFQCFSLCGPFTALLIELEWAALCGISLSNEHLCRSSSKHDRDNKQRRVSDGEK